MPVTRVERRARALFAAVLHLYPASYRDEYGREMTLVLVDRLRGEHTAVARVVVFLGAIAAVLADAPKQHALVLAQDLRLALRLIRRERWFATVAIGTVAIGIALSTAVFSVGKSLLVDALPYREAERATMVWVTNPRQGFDRDVTSYPRLLAWREHSQLIETFASYAFRRAVVTGIGDPEQLLVVRATPEFFRRRSDRADRGTIVRRDRRTSRSRRARLRSLATKIRRATRARSVKSCDWIRSRTPSSGCCRQSFQFPARDLDAWVPLQPSAEERSSGAFWLRDRRATQARCVTCTGATRNDRDRGAAGG